MKKKFLAVNVALALGAMSGVAMAASAPSILPVPGDFLAAVGEKANAFTVASGNVVVADNNIGLINIVPYYSVQNGNTIALTITNNDQLNGKAVKVRFRGAEWSDDVLDFQLFLSPYDVWTAAITKGTDGVARITTHGATGDQSCTLPGSIVDQKFANDVRLASGSVGGTLEGYVEIITAADIPPRIHTGASGDVDDTAVSSTTNTVGANPLFGIIKHTANGTSWTPKCRTEDAAYKALVDLQQDNYWTNSTAKVGASVVTAGTNAGLHLYSTDDAVAQSNGASYTTTVSGSSVTYNQFGNDLTRSSDDWLQFPTVGISTSVSIINVENLRAYTLQATALKNAPALVVDNGNDLYRSLATDNSNDDQGVGAIKNYFRQRGTTADAVTWSPALTADKIFAPTNPDPNVAPTLVQGGANVRLVQWDLPDLSTPTLAEVASITPAASDSISIGNITNGISTGAAHIYHGGAATAQRDLVAYALQAPGFAFDYVTEPLVEGSTDIVINQPLRRYYYWYDRQATTATAGNFHRQFVTTEGAPDPEAKFKIWGEANTPYEVLDGLSNSVPLGSTSSPAYIVTGREEEKGPVSSGDVGFSPAPAVPGAQAGLFGEVSIISINTPDETDSIALGAKLTVNHLRTGYDNGWGWYSTSSVSGRAAGHRFLPTTATNAYGLTAHPLLVGGAYNSEPYNTPWNLGIAGSRWLPFIAYGAINVNSPANAHQAYGTTIPVRKGPAINPQ